MRILNSDSQEGLCGGQTSAEQCDPSSIFGILFTRHSLTLLPSTFDRFNCC